jgi:hypothetical protein
MRAVPSILLSGIMQRINGFLSSISNARKRTGILYATEEFETVISRCLSQGYMLSEAENQVGKNAFLKDDELIANIKLGTAEKPILYIGLETFIGPRFDDTGFVEQFVKKLIVEEPTYPVVLLLYSRKLFQVFSRLYGLYLPNQIHSLDLSTPELTENEYA